jgi:hypothetical protein
MSTTDDWIDVPPLASPKADDGWIDVPKAGAPVPAPPISGADKAIPYWVQNPTITPEEKPLANGYFSNILKQFGQDFGQAWGPEKLGLSDESMNRIKAAGIPLPSDKDNDPRGTNGFVVVNAAAALDAAMRTFPAFYHGMQGAINAALGDTRLSRDIVSIPDAFMGSPGTLGKITLRPGLPKDDVPPGSPPPPPALAEPLAKWSEEIDTRVKSAMESMPQEVGEKFRADIKELDELLAKPQSETTVEINGESTTQRTPLSGADTDRVTELKDNIRQTLEDHGYTEPPNPVVEAVKDGKDLGVIGPERSSINEGTPQEVAERSARGADEAAQKPKESVPGVDGWQARFDHFVGRIDKPADIKKLIHDAATENDNFPAARQGKIPAMDVSDIADATGLDPSEINAKKLGQALPTDQHVRFAMRAMITATENVKAAARDVVSDASEANLIKFQEHILRRDMMVEQVVGLRSQWGRVGNVFQEFMREVKDGQALDSFIKESCPL